MSELNSREMILCFKALVFQRDALKALQTKAPNTPRQWQIDQLDRVIANLRKQVEMFLGESEAA